MPTTRRRRLSGALIGAALTLAGSIGAAQSASAAAPPVQEYFICPSVSTHNAQGTWVIGAHGAYYVLVPTQGSTGGKVYLTVPTRVASQAQVPAGWALYKDIIHTTAPDGTLIFTTDVTANGTAMLLQEGLTWFPGAATLGWSEGDLLSITSDGAGGYLVHDLGNAMMGVGDKGVIHLVGQYVPAASGAVW